MPTRESYAYDAAGSRCYVYDEQHRLIAIKTLRGISQVTAEYDALGRRVRLTRYNANGEAIADTRFVYDGQRILAEFDALQTPPTLLRYYINGPLYVDEHVLLRNAATGQERYYVLQELYTVAGLANAAGNLAEAYLYDAYGQVRMYDVSGGTPVLVGSSPAGSRYFFTGRELDAVPTATGDRQFYHYRARAYDPRDGRFVQRDPAEYADDANLYEYAGSNPASRTDPSGLEWVQDEKDSNIWIARPGGDKASLKNLVKELMKRNFAVHLKPSEDWACIWPIAPEDATDDKWAQMLAPRYNAGTDMADPIIKPPGSCLRFDVSNLSSEKGASIKAMIAVVPKSDDVAAKFGLTVMNITALADRIKNSSKEGKTPISELIVWGHGSSEETALTTRPGGGDKFEVTLLKDMWRPREQDFARAYAKRGPPRCWFATDAKVRLIGCRTSGLGNAWKRAFGRADQSFGWTLKDLEREPDAEVHFIDIEGKPVQPEVSYPSLEGLYSSSHWREAWMP